MSKSWVDKFSDAFFEAAKAAFKEIFLPDEFDQYREKVCRDNGWNNFHLRDVDVVINDIIIAGGHEYVPDDSGNEAFEAEIMRYLEQENPELMKKLEANKVTAQQIRKYYQDSPDGYIWRIRNYVMADAQKLFFG